MKKVHLNLLLTATLSIVFFSCEKEQYLEQEIAKETVQHSADELRTAFAKNLALALVNKELRLFLKTEALKQFDGDYDILFNMAKNNVVTEDGQTFYELLEANWESEISLEEIVTSLPTLNILIPDLLLAPTELWDTKEHIPLVAVKNSEQHQKGIDYLPAYNSKAERKEIYAFEDPTETTIVVESSERVVAVSNNNKEINLRKVTEEGWISIFEENDYEYFITSRDFLPSSPVSMNARVPGLPSLYAGYLESANGRASCPRETLYYGNTSNLFYWVDERDKPLNVNIKERLQLIRFTTGFASRTAADGWSESSLELRCNVLLGGQNSAAFQSVLLTRSVPRILVEMTVGANGYYRDLEDWLLTKPSNLRNSYRSYAEYYESRGLLATVFNRALAPESSQGLWINWGGAVVNWSIHKYGDRMKYVFYEYDPGEKVTQIRNYSVGFNASIGKKDVFNIGFSGQKSGSTTIEYTNTSDQLGENIVDYCGRYWIVVPPFSPGNIEFVVATY